MTAEELDLVYTSLAEAVGRVGEDRASLLLAALSLELLAHHPDRAAALDAIARAERACAR